MSSPAIFYYDFCVIPPQRAHKAEQLVPVGSRGGGVLSAAGGLGLHWGHPLSSSPNATGAAMPTLKCNIDFFGRARRVVFCVPVLFTLKVFFLFFISFPLPACSPFLINVCSGRQHSKISCDAQRTVVLVSVKLTLWSTSFPWGGFFQRS